MLTQAQRIRNFDREFPSTVSKEGNSTLFIHNGRITGLWDIGALYKRNYFRNEKAGYYGAYPHRFKERVFALFPDCKNVLHLFSGTIQPSQSDRRREITFDIREEMKPTIRDDVRNISKYAKTIHEQHLILADPMYERPDWEKVGQIPFDKWAVIRKLGTMMCRGAFLAWFDTRVPLFSGKTWGHRYASIGVEVSTNTRIRALTILQKGGPRR